MANYTSTSQYNHDVSQDKLYIALFPIHSFFASASEALLSDSESVNMTDSKLDGRRLDMRLSCALADVNAVSLLA